MKHMLHDPKAEEELGNQFTIFSCEFDSGKRAQGNNDIIRLGEDGKIMLFLCQSCFDQLSGQFLHSVVVDALRGKSLEELIRKSILDKNK